MRTALIIILLGFCFNTFSQQVVKEFGKISTEEIELKAYDKDPDANALILYDRGETKFVKSRDGFNIQFTRHKRIKIFDKSAIEYAAVSIPLFRSKKRREKLISVKAITYNFVNGTVQEKEVLPSDIYEEKINFTCNNTKFIFPDVQDGSILELKYVIESPFKYNLPEWRFQDRIPTLYSECEVSIVPFYEYAFISNAITGFDYKDKYISHKDRYYNIKFNDCVFTFALKDVPAFEDESYIASINDYIMKLEFQLAKRCDINGMVTITLSTWPALNKDLIRYEHFGKYIKKCESIAKKVLETELDISGLTQEEQYPIIINYVKDHFEWNQRDTKYARQSAKQFFEKKSGNSAEINLFLIALLNTAGVDAEPVILSTRSHGKIRHKYPFNHFTNYVVAKINTDDSYFFSDATDPLLKYDRLPKKCLNGKGLIVSKSKEATWLNLVRDWNSTKKSNITLTVDTITKDVNVLLSMESTEYNSWSERNKFKGDTIKIKEHYSEQVNQLNKIVVSDYKEASVPYSVKIEGARETDKIAQNIVIKPFLDLPLSTNNLTQEERNYPIDFVSPWKREFESTLTIPSGYKVTSQPNYFEIDNELVEIALNGILEGDILTIKGIYYFKKAIYEASEYTKIKEYFSQIINHFNQPVVIEKID